MARKPSPDPIPCEPLVELRLLWLAGLFVAMPAFLGLIWMLADPLAGNIDAWILLFASIAAGATLRWATFPVEYRLKEDALAIRFGTSVALSIPYDDLLAITPIESLLPAPAWATRRLQIAYQTPSRTQHIMIAPKDQQAFLELLAQRAEGLQFTADRSSLIREADDSQSGKP